MDKMVALDDEEDMVRVSWWVNWRWRRVSDEVIGNGEIGPVISTAPVGLIPLASYRSDRCALPPPSSPPRSPHFTYSYFYLSSPLLSSHKTWTTHHTPVEVVGAVTIRLYNSPMGT